MYIVYLGVIIFAIRIFYERHCFTSGMLSIVGEWESAHAKFEACTALWYVQCGLHTYNRPFTSLGGLSLFANYISSYTGQRNQEGMRKTNFRPESNPGLTTSKRAH